MSDSQYDTGIGPLMAKVLEQQREIEQLRKERDEARREVCELKSHNFEEKISPKAYAELRKWDCYKEDCK